MDHKHMRYLGASGRLHKKTAMVYLPGSSMHCGGTRRKFDPAKAYAQFDDRGLREAYGWHAFEPDDFVEVEHDDE